MVRGNMVRGRFRTFLAAMVVLACILVIGYVYLSHPGDTKDNVKPLDTSSLTLQQQPVA